MKKAYNIIPHGKIVKIQGLLTLIFLIWLPLHFGQAESGVIIGGIRSNSTNLAGIGIITKMDTSLYFTTWVTTGDLQTNVQTHPVLALPIANNATLDFILGPEATIVDDTTQASKLIYYLSMTAGISISYNLSKQYTLFAGVEYRPNYNNISKPNLGGGVVIWLK